MATETNPNVYVLESFPGDIEGVFSSVSAAAQYLAGRGASGLTLRAFVIGEGFYRGDSCTDELEQECLRLYGATP